MKKLIAASIASIGLAASMPASALTVGGINFGALGDAGVHLETATLAETFVNAPGQHLQGYGIVTTMNGAANYCAVGSCSLYFYFDYTVSSFNGAQVTFGSGDVYLYRGAANFNLLSQNSAANVAMIQGMTPWAHMGGHTFADPIFNAIIGNPLATYVLNGNGLLTGASLSESGQGQLDMVNDFGDASVYNSLNTDSIPDFLGGFADVVVTSSTNNFVLNPFDLASALGDSCLSGNPQPGDWCLQGTLNGRGRMIPEPGTLALAGAALLGLGAIRRRRTNV